MSSELVVIAIALLLCFGGSSAIEKVDWWEAATYYQIYPRSFMDSDGNGIGDLNGITSRLAYLKDIGVTAAWISPIFVSPMADNGYDIANFTDIEPLFGTIADFDRLIQTAHKLGLKIILDFVPNHSSDECEWFQKSIRREDGYDDFYIWSDGKINEKTGERTVPNNYLSEFGGSGWTWNEERQQYYFHQFLAKQPDFDMTNPKVRKLLLEIMQFWLDRGVDAFRIDAIPFFVEKRFENGTFPDNPPNSRDNQLNQPEVLDILYEWRDYLDNYQLVHGGDTRFMLGEAYGTMKVISSYVGNGTHKGVQMPMNLIPVYLGNPIYGGDVNASLFNDVANMWMGEMWTKHKIANWVVGNHDNRRVATRMGQNRADLWNIIIHSMPGASVTYNGEEIGMSDGETNCVTNCNFRDPYRTPMQWDTSKNAGFSTADSTWLPINPNHEFINVQTERKKSRSSLQIFKNMVKLKQRPAFRAFKEDGAFEYGAYNTQIFHIMRTDKITEEYRILVNFGHQIESVEGLSNQTMEYVVLNSYSPHKKREKVDLSKQIYLMPFEAVVLRRTL